VKEGCGTMDRRSLGERGEALAIAHLQKQGMRIEARNFRCRLGEIDLVARDGETLVFIEVRSRASTGCGLPQETVNHRKRKRLRRLAEFYLLGREQTPVRFDVVAVLFDREGNLRRLEHIPDAF